MHVKMGIKFCTATSKLLPIEKFDDVLRDYEFLPAFNLQITIDRASL